MVKQTLEEKIRQRRAQMLVHSYFYYIEDDPIVEDHVWQKWANELVDLQKRKKKIEYYDRQFQNWDGSSGAFLPLNDPYVIGLSNYVRNIFTREEEKSKIDKNTTLEDFFE